VKCEIELADYSDYKYQSLVRFVKEVFQHKNNWS